MRTLALIIALPLAIAPLAACSIDGSDSDSTPGLPGSGSGTTRTFAATDFTAVELRGSDDVDVRVGTAFSVRAEGPAAELDKLKIERDGDTLKIGRIGRKGFNWSDDSKGKVTVYVTMPRIAEASVAGSGNLGVDRVEGQAFEGELAGSGNLTIATLAVQQAKFDIAGSGNTKVSGTTGRFEANIAGSGDIDGAGLKASSAEVSIAGSGNVKAEVAGQAKVNVMGSGDVDLGRNAKCATSKMGSGAVTCG